MSDPWTEQEADQGTIWFSSLIRRDNANRQLRANFIGSNIAWYMSVPGTITLVNDNDTDEWNGITDVWHIGTEGGSFTSTGISSVQDQTQLLLVKFDFNGTSSEVRFWVYGDPSSLPGSTPADASAHAVLTGLDQDAIGFKGVAFYLHYSAGSGSVDEIRFGTTYADVVPAVPEPGILSLLALSGTLALRRRV